MFRTPAGRPASCASRAKSHAVAGVSSAAFKTAALVSRLVQAGAGVSVVMTRSATRLVGPKTFEALTGRPVQTRVFGRGGHPHIELATAAELLCVAPATANILAKIAHGIADDLCSTLLTTVSPTGDGTPVMLAPAMNERMWSNPFVQANVARLREAGYLIVGPERGWMACRTTSSISSLDIC